MQRKIVFIFIIVLFLVFSAGKFVFAQELRLPGANFSPEKFFGYFHIFEEKTDFLFGGKDRRTGGVRFPIIGLFEKDNAASEITANTGRQAWLAVDEIRSPERRRENLKILMGPVKDFLFLFFKNLYKTIAETAEGVVYFFTLIFEEALRISFDIDLQTIKQKAIFW